MHITLVEPFFGGSHRRWAEEFQQFSQHRVELCTLPGRHWKWRMVGGAVSLGLRQRSAKSKPDLLLCSSMLDLPTFLTTAGLQSVPTAMYFHENQLAYPWSPDDPDPKLDRDHHYGFIQFKSALCADRVFFNSEYNRNSFLSGLAALLKRFPDQRMLDQVPLLEAKSEVLPLGMALHQLDAEPAIKKEGPAVLLWNHRWEYDKRPERFFQLCADLQDRGVDFELVVLGAATGKYPSVFDEARVRFADRSLHFGYAPSRAAYARWINSCDILPVTSIQDFFGISVVEAMYCGLWPVLPRRLAYPEHLTDDLRDTFLYEDEAGLLNKTVQSIQKVNHWRRGEGLRGLVAQYDWLNLANRYDELFSKMIA